MGVREEREMLAFFSFCGRKRWLEIPTCSTSSMPCGRTSFQQHLTWSPVDLFSTPVFQELQKDRSLANFSNIYATALQNLSATNRCRASSVAVSTQGK